MKNAILIHGMTSKVEYFRDIFPSPSNSHWFPWLQKQLLMRKILTQTPEMPTPYDPNYNEWKKAFERLHMYDHTLIVGHSFGAGFLIRWFSDSKKRAAKLILIAPWLDLTKEETGTFFNFRIDPTLGQRIKNIHIFVSDDDTRHGIEESVGLITKAIPTAKIHRFTHKGHFTTSDMKSQMFPELLQILLSE